MRWLPVLAIALRLTAAQPAPVSGPLLSCDGWRRATALSEWTSDLMRIAGVAAASETAQGKAFLECLRIRNSQSDSRYTRVEMPTVSRRAMLLAGAALPTQAGAPAVPMCGFRGMAISVPN